MLGFPKTGSPDRARVETEFNRLFREHQAKLNSALTKEEREKEAKILVLLKQAKNICLGVGGAGTQTPTQNTGTPYPASWTGIPQAAFRPKRRRYSGNGSIQDAAKKLGDVFVHLWLSLKNLLGFLRAVPAAFMEIKDFVCDVLDQVQTAGIPKPVTILVLILVCLPLISGCAHAIQKMACWFK